MLPVSIYFAVISVKILHSQVLHSSFHSKMQQFTTYHPTAQSDVK